MQMQDQQTRFFQSNERLKYANASLTNKISSTQWKVKICKCNINKQRFVQPNEKLKYANASLMNKLSSTQWKVKICKCNVNKQDLFNPTREVKNMQMQC